MIFKRVAVSLSAIFLIFSVFSPFVYCSVFERENLDSFPGPTLLSPTTDNIDLKGKDDLEFRWEITNLGQTDNFDFRLYKGYDTTASNLIYKKQYSVSELPIKISASLFTADQVYTWVLGQVFIGGNKSDKSFSSFKIISSDKVVQ